MIPRRVVRRYAAALFVAARKANAVDMVESDLGLVSFALENSTTLREAVRSPVLSVEKKQEILQDIFGGRVHQITLDYLYLLVRQRREEAMELTQEEYVLLANEARGLVEADVVTAVDLNADEDTRLCSKLSKVTGKSVRLRKSVDPQIIGGVIVRIADRMIDGSIRGRLEELREELAK